MALPLSEPAAMATLRAALAALPTTAEGQAFANATVQAVEAVHQELAEIYVRNEQAHEIMRTHLTVADERHASAHLEVQHGPGCHRLL